MTTKEQIAKMIEEWEEKQDNKKLAEILKALNERCLNEKISEETTFSAGKEFEKRLTSILREIGVPTHILGYRYLRTAINYMYHQEIPISMTRDLYPEVAKVHRTTASRVERAIRHTIEVTYDNGYSMDVLNRIFGNTISPMKGKPTNSHFLAQIVFYMRDEEEK